MPRRSVLLVLLGLAAVGLAGCSGQGPPASAPGGDVVPSGMTIVGLVQNETFVPVPGAQVSLRETEHVTATDAGGLFTFTGVPLSPYLVDVAAPGFLNATLTADPTQNVSLSFVLVRPAAGIPPPVVVHFTGYYECAFEVVIIPGSCDILLEMAGQDVFDDLSSFETGLGPRWSTAVVDVDFEPQPGLDGLRVTLRAKSDADQLGTYEEYGKFHGSTSFSFRVEPGQTLPEGDRAMPANATGLQMDVYPQGHAWHPGGVPVLGVGAGRDIVFDVYVTVFFVEPAPAGYSLLA